jgi:hypothetical protein
MTIDNYHNEDYATYYIFMEVGLKMKKLLLVCLMLTGCGLSAHTTKVNLPSGEAGFTVSCNGFAGWDKCYEAAGNICKTGYDIVNKEGDKQLDVQGTPRSMMIKCK